jgi:hypothetical protein
MQALAQMVAADERLALKTPQEAARRALLVASAEEARNLAALDAAFAAQAVEQASRLQEATLQQRLRHLAVTEASATDEAVAVEAARMRAAREAAAAAVKERLEADETWLSQQQADRDAAIAVKLAEVAAGGQSVLPEFVGARFLAWYEFCGSGGCMRALRKAATAAVKGRLDADQAWLTGMRRLL